MNTFCVWCPLIRIFMCSGNLAVDQTYHSRQRNTRVSFQSLVLSLSCWRLKSCANKLKYRPRDCPQWLEVVFFSECTGLVWNAGAEGRLSLSGGAGSVQWLAATSRIFPPADCSQLQCYARWGGRWEMTGQMLDTHSLNLTQCWCVRHCSLTVPASLCVASVLLWWPVLSWSILRGATQ